MITKEKILDAIKQHAPQEIISGIVVDGAKIGFALESTDESLRKACEKAVFALSGVEKVTVVLTGTAGRIKIENKNTEMLDRRQKIAGVKKVIAVAAGKGGVGKSTVAVNLALALSGFGKKVGIVDADIYGPSIPKMLGMNKKPEVEGDKMLPLKSVGLYCNSMGFLIEENTAAIWRGPMATKAIHQLFLGTKWDIEGELDYLIIDFPPGTGDIQLSIAQNYKLDGAVIVSTPQEVALADVKKAAHMFYRVNIPILGVIENMAYFVDPVSNNKSYIFGQGGAKKFAAEIGAKFLGEVPLIQKFRENGDNGTPEQTEIFDKIAENLMA